jgi:hypothetical protein
MLLPEKPDKTTGRPIIVPFRKILDSIFYMSQELDVSGKCFQRRSMLPALQQVIIEDFRSGHYLKYLKNYGLDYYKFMMTLKVFDRTG